MSPAPPAALARITAFAAALALALPAAEASGGVTVTICSPGGTPREVPFPYDPDAPEAPDGKAGGCHAPCLHEKRKAPAPSRAG